MNRPEDPDKFIREGVVKRFPPRDVRFTIAGENENGNGLPMTLYDGINDRPVKHWLVKGMFGAGEVSALYGAPGSGKSVLAGDLAFHVAAGEPWFGRRVSKGAVLYIAAERGSLVLRRLAALRKQTGKRNLPLGVVTQSIILSLDAADVVSTARTLERKTGEPVALIVVDTLAQTLGGADENSAKDMGEALGAVKHIQEATGAHVMIVHHSPIEAATRLRGHSSLLGACDTTMAVTKRGKVRHAEVMKANDGEEGLSIEFDLESVVVATDDDGDDTTAPVVNPVDRDSVTGVTSERDVSRPLPASAELAKRALEEAIIEHGKPPPPGDHFPPGVRVVPVEAWKETVYRMGLGIESPKHRRTAFKRAKDTLQARRIIGIWDDLVWIVRAESVT